MNNKIKVGILMSTYNGEKFIKEQIKSILEQKDVEVYLYIRDDGSNDSTVSIINEYVQKYNSMSLTEGENLGFADSFMWLVKNCPRCDYYAFADQDDIWDKNKIIRAIKFLEKEKPMLYASNLNVFNMVEGTEYKLYENYQKEKILSNLYKYPYFYNPYGCTMVWNELLQQQLLCYEKPTKQTHDIWVNLIASYTGEVYFDFDSYINYRIHGGNACGATPKNIFDRIKKYYKFYFVDNKSLTISLSCQTIDKLFPKKTNKNIKNIAEYKRSFFYKLKAVNTLLKMDIEFAAKRKFLLLLIFNRL